MAVMRQKELTDRGYLCVMDLWIVKWQGKQDFYLPRYNIEDLGGGILLLSVFSSKQ